MGVRHRAGAHAGGIGFRLGGARVAASRARWRRTPRRARSGSHASRREPGARPSVGSRDAALARHSAISGQPLEQSGFFGRFLRAAGHVVHGHVRHVHRPAWSSPCRGDRPADSRTRVSRHGRVHARSGRGSGHRRQGEAEDRQQRQQSPKGKPKGHGRRMPNSAVGRKPVPTSSNDAGPGWLHAPVRRARPGTLPH